MFTRLALALALLLLVASPAAAFELTLFPVLFCHGQLTLTAEADGIGSYVLRGSEAGCGGARHPIVGTATPNGAHWQVILRVARYVYQWTGLFTGIAPALWPVAIEEKYIVIDLDATGQGTWSQLDGSHGPAWVTE